MRKDFYSYPAIFYYDEDGVSVEFPDLPGCLTCAHSTEEAFRCAREAMGLHLCGMEDDGDPIPDPTPFEKIRPEENGIVGIESQTGLSVKYENWSARAGGPFLFACQALDVKK